MPAGISGTSNDYDRLLYYLIGLLYIVFGLEAYLVYSPPFGRLQLGLGAVALSVFGLAVTLVRCRIARPSLEALFRGAMWVSIAVALAGTLALLLAAAGDPAAAVPFGGLALPGIMGLVISRRRAEFLPPWP